MPIPPPVMRLLPSLDWEAAPPDNASLTLTIGELRGLIGTLAAAEVDEAWYLAQYPDVRDGIARGGARSATEHYCTAGYFEGRLPADPPVDEDWYRATNPDVAAGIRQGKFRTAKEHYILNGYKEGRAAYPEQPAASPGAPQSTAARFAPRPRF